MSMNWSFSTRQNKHIKSAYDDEEDATNIKCLDVLALAFALAQAQERLHSEAKLGDILPDSRPLAVRGPRRDRPSMAGFQDI